MALLGTALLASGASADELPVALQVQLLSKMSTYIIGFGAGESSAVKVLVVHPGSAEAPSRGSQALVGAIGQMGQFGSLKVEAKLAPLTDVKTLQAQLASEKPQVVYLAPELSEKNVATIIEALGSSTAVTISGVTEHVKAGVVLGFSLFEARPRVFVNLGKARKQNIQFHNGLLRYAIVVEGGG
ncbi:MAG: YfiR family protein [Myxococcaceae bacterium]